MRSTLCILPSDQLKIQPAITVFSPGEFHQQPVLSNNTDDKSAEFGLLLTILTHQLNQTLPAP